MLATPEQMQERLRRVKFSVENHDVRRQMDALVGGAHVVFRSAADRKAAAQYAHNAARGQFSLRSITTGVRVTRKVAQTQSL